MTQRKPQPTIQINQLDMIPVSTREAERIGREGLSYDGITLKGARPANMPLFIKPPLHTRLMHRALQVRDGAAHLLALMLELLEQVKAEPWSSHFNRLRRHRRWLAAGSSAFILALVLTGWVIGAAFETVVKNENATFTETRIQQQKMLQRAALHWATSDSASQDAAPMGRRL